MKNYVLFCCLVITGITSGCRKHDWVKPGWSCSPNAPVNLYHPMKDSLQAIVNKYIVQGIPGIQVAVKNESGFYVTQGAFAGIAGNTAMEPCSTSWLFSITKTYTASLVMKFNEKGMIDLENAIDKYLPEEVSEGIAGSDSITVRMLLNHTSGLVEFTTLPEYISAQFDHPLKQPSIEDILAMLKGQLLISKPGAVFNYCNTNYLLLHLILEKVSGKSYEYLLKNLILAPLGLQHTYYHLTAGQISSLGFPDYYFDPRANGELENVTLWNNALGNACYGWGGIAATASDVILFYEALMRGNVVSKTSLIEMKKWFRSEGSQQPEYGLGIEYYQYAEGSNPQMGHEGDGIGCSTFILYVPDNDTYLYVNCTAGRKLGGPYLFRITDLKNELGRYVAGWRK